MIDGIKEKEEYDEDRDGYLEGLKELLSGDGVEYDVEV